MPSPANNRQNAQDRENINGIPFLWLLVHRFPSQYNARKNVIMRFYRTLKVILSFIQ